jgi:hypothetical protein
MIFLIQFYILVEGFSFEEQDNNIFFFDVKKWRIKTIHNIYAIISTLPDLVSFDDNLKILKKKRTGTLYWQIHFGV